MSQKTLERAISKLSFVDVSVRNAMAEMADDFEPKFDERSKDLSFQLKNQVTSSAIMELSSEQDKDYIFRVTSALGVRIAATGEFEKEDPEILVTVEAIIEADYEVKDLSLIADQEALDVFALKNVPYHVWPYWREFVSSQLLRMNVPKVVLPMMGKAVNGSLQQVRTEPSE